MHQGRWWWKHEMKKLAEIRQPVVQSHIFSWHWTKVRRCLLSANLDMHRWKKLTSFEALISKVEAASISSSSSWGSQVQRWMMMWQLRYMVQHLKKRVHLWRLTWKQNYMWPYASAATYYVTGFGREGAGHEFSEFLLPHWTLDDLLCLVSMTE